MGLVSRSAREAARTMTRRRTPDVGKKVTYGPGRDTPQSGISWYVDLRTGRALQRVRGGGAATDSCAARIRPRARVKRGRVIFFLHLMRDCTSTMFPLLVTMRVARRYNPAMAILPFQE